MDVHWLVWVLVLSLIALAIYRLVIRPMMEQMQVLLKENPVVPKRFAGMFLAVTAVYLAIIVIAMLIVSIKFVALGR